MDQANIDHLFATLSQNGRNIKATLAGQAANFRSVVRKTPSGKPVNWASEAWLTKLLTDIEKLQTSPALSGAGPDVVSEEADQSGLLFRVDSGAKPFAISLLDALNLMSQGTSVLIGGAGSPLGDFVRGAYDFAYTSRSNSLIVQYVGVDFVHYATSGSLPQLAALLEVNLLKTAVLQCANAALNASKRPSLVISSGMASWVVNRALRVFPAADMPFARNLQINPFGPEDAMEELTHAKVGLYGKICSVHMEASAARAQALFNLHPDTLKKVPADIRIPSSGTKQATP